MSLPHKKDLLLRTNWIRLCLKIGVMILRMTRICQKARKGSGMFGKLLGFSRNNFLLISFSLWNCSFTEPPIRKKSIRRRKINLEVHPSGPSATRVTGVKCCVNLEDGWIFHSKGKVGYPWESTKGNIYQHKPPIYGIYNGWVPTFSLWIWAIYYKPPTFGGKIRSRLESPGLETFIMMLRVSGQITMIPKPQFSATLASGFP